MVQLTKKNTDLIARSEAVNRKSKLFSVTLL
jgi:hypothetical protein